MDKRKTNGRDTPRLQCPTPATLPDPGHAAIARRGRGRRQQLVPFTAGDEGENKCQWAGGDPATAIRLQDILSESTDPIELKAKFNLPQIPGHEVSTGIWSEMMSSFNPPCKVYLLCCSRHKKTNPHISKLSEGVLCFAKGTW